MRRLFPEPATDLTDLHAAYADVPKRWLRIGMVMSADGSATDEETWTDGLGGDADFAVFRTLRALADGILIGAGTVRTGRVGPARQGAGLRELRGRGPAAMVVVSRSLRLDWDLPLFRAAETPTIVVTSAAALTRRDVPAGACELVVAGEEEVDLRAAVTELRGRFGLDQLLCEGGPALTTAVLTAGLADELCVNLASTLIGTPYHTRLIGDLHGRIELTPTAVYLDEPGRVLFLRYRPGQPAGS